MKAIVCGAGIAGLTVASELGLAGWDVVVLEKAQKRRELGYMIDFFGPGYAAAEKMGLLPRLTELAYPVDRVEFVGPKGPTASISYGPVTRAQFGNLISLLRQDIEQALFERLPASVELRFGRTVSSIENAPDAVTVVLDDGTRETADVLIGADGIHSRVREQVFGPEKQFLRYLGFHTAAFTFDDAELSEKFRTVWAMTDTIDRFVGLYGVRNGQVAVMAAHREEDVRLPDDRRSAVLTAYAGMDWLVPEVLSHCPEDAELYYDQVAQIELPQWSNGRVVLIGDACGAVSLLAGQGASLAVSGGHFLAHELAAVQSNDAPNIADAFARFETRWKPVVLEKQAAGRRAASSFLPHTRWMRFVRRWGLRMLQVPGLGKLVSSRIAGKESSALA